MICSYEPYKITSNLEVVDDFTFIDKELSRRIALFSDCAEVINPPCSDAIVLHVEDNCPDSCKVFWYECPSEMGRRYTVLPTPCGVKITSFEDGLVIAGDCEATLFGSELFCFGKIYTTLGVFESLDKSLTTFEFDGHTFTVRGVLGDCNELYDCTDCQIDSQSTMTFEDLPTPPEDISIEEPPGEDEIISDVDTPATEVIPTEGRVEWQDWISSAITVGQDTICENEKPLKAVDFCESNDNPAIATLPSGHTVVAYENRGENGITKITVAVLSSSVRENIRSHRKLGTGTLLNNLAESEGVATFIVYEDMHIPVDNDKAPPAGTRIGFLTGPLAGSLLAIEKITRFRDGDAVRHEFNFTAANAEFPDKNNVYDVNWFIVDNQSSADLPSSENITTILDLPDHTDVLGNSVPVSNPAIGVAQNNQMVSNEQNIYIVYQAFENNQWHVYLREIILGTVARLCLGGDNDGGACSNGSDCPGGTCSGGIAPTYIAPYLFDENVRQITIMSADDSPVVSIMGSVPSITFYDESFTGAGLQVGQSIATNGRWNVLTDTDIPAWFWNSPAGSVSYITTPLVFCDSQGPLEATGLPNTPCSGGVPCSAVFNSQTCSDVGQDDSSLLLDHTRSFVVNKTPTTTVDRLVIYRSINLSFKLRFHIVLNETTTTGSGLVEYPEIWFLIGRSQFENVSFHEGYRLQIRRGQILSSDSMNINNSSQEDGVTICSQGGVECSVNHCFIISLYKNYSPQWTGMNSLFDVNAATGGQSDLPVRVKWECINNANLGLPGDYSFDDWNEWRVDTYVRGFYRFFELYLTHPNGTEVLITTLREWEQSIDSFASTEIPYALGPYHGFGFVQSFHDDLSQRAKHQVLIDSFSASTIPSSATDKIYFFEDFCDRDRLFANAPISNVSNSSRMMLDEPIATNTDYDGSRLLYQSNMFGDRFYDLGRTEPDFFETSIQLGPDFNQNFPSNGWASYLRIRPSATDRDPTNVGASHQDAISMVISVNRRWIKHSGAWPHVWFVGRLNSNNPADGQGKWHGRYRLRISRFNCVSDYPSLNSPTGLSEGDKVWRFSAYNSGSGLKTDSPASEDFLIIGPAGDTILDWTEWLPSGSGTEPGKQSIWNYFRIDMYDNAGQVVFDIYTGDDTLVSNPDDIEFELLNSMSINPIATGSDGPYFGAALFSGATDESAEGLSSGGVGDDYSSSAHLNYISLSTIGAAGELLRGACCRFIGGCDSDVLSTGCFPSDIWHGGQTCGEAECTDDFPVGAGCTDDGNCHDGITLAEATDQGIGLCTNCSWQEDTDCNGGGTDRGCPGATATGRCCRPYHYQPGYPACINNSTLEQCKVYYGNSLPGSGFVVGEICSVGGCPNVENGACCRPSGCSITATSEQCLSSGGLFFARQDCVTTDCPTDGACCDGGGGCTQASEAACEAANSTFWGIGASCTPDPCTSPDRGACCFDDDVCTDTLESACGGTWFYSEKCEDSPCPTTTGACCDPFTGECEDDTFAFDCQNGKTYLGPGSICSYINCTQPRGACCVGLNCVGGKTLPECTDLGGSYLGHFSNCIEGICLGGLDDPYSAIAINYKPEDLWVIETAPNEYITRVLYHMQEEINVSSLQAGNTDNTVDFMFLIDSSGSMFAEIQNVVIAVPDLATSMLSRGLDVRFGFTIFGRGIGGLPRPPVRHVCECGGSVSSDMADGLQVVTRCKTGNPDQLEGAPVTVNGFTRNVEYLQRALNCWGTSGGKTSPWSAIQFCLEDSQFVWRENAAKFVFFITDAHSVECSECGSWSRVQADATNALINAGAILVPVFHLNEPSVNYLEVAEASGWTGGLLDINTEDYGDIFEQVVNTIDSTLRVDNATVIERATEGTAATYLKKGEVIVSYEGDLSDLWTFDKADFEFSDDHVPFPGTNTKQLTNLPFPLASGKIYGIDSVHIQGNPNNWVSFESEGALLYSHPNVGHRASGTSEVPVLISSNSARPKVYVNNRNQIMVAYENYTTGTPQIEIKGTGDFHQNSITGPRANRIARMLNQNDFVYRHTITLPGEGVNQLCDFVIDNSDVTHVVWQSNRDGYWEIYYGNSFNMFEPVRITKADSRSSHPSIDLDETGSIFVVYHDDRFGPFNIMISSKDEERVIPLLEQDAYLASLRTGYTHYTNTIPLFLDNPSSKAFDLGRFWANKDEDGAGNDSETFVYQIDETTGIPSNGVDLKALSPLFRPKSIAFSSTALWGISPDGQLLKLGQIADDNDTVAFSPLVIGTINLNINGFNSSAILDMAVDKFDRIWILIHEIEDVGGSPAFSLIPSGLPMVETMAVNNRLRLEYVSGLNAATLARGIILENDVDGPDGGSLAITSDNKFFVTWENSPDVVLSSSEYPDIFESVATFNFIGIGNLTPALTPFSMTVDASDTLFSVSSDNDLYSIDNSTGGATLQTSLTSGSGDEPSLPVGTTSGIAYQLLDVGAAGEAQFFHIRIDFYDNISFEGDLFLSADSRDNLEAFINDETLDDPYAAFGMGARGAFLQLDEVGIVFFDATNFVPGFSRSSQPYSFEPNQTYFLKVFLIDANGNVRESRLPQSNSFSCSKCSRFGNNNFNTSSCSYSFVIPNSNEDTQSFNFQIDFYADTGKQHLIRRFEAIPGSEDLQYMEVDNIPAIDRWTEFGLPIIGGDSAFVQIYPVLDPAAGFLCGVTYTVQVNECHSAETVCSGFSIVTPSNWFGALVGENHENVKDQAETDEVMLSLSMKSINNKLSIAWSDPEGNLNFIQLDENGWASYPVVRAGILKVVYCDLSEINGFPSIATVARGGGNTFESVFTYDGEWYDWTNMTGFQADILVNPRSLLELDDAPMVAFVGRSNSSPTLVLNSGRSTTWAAEPSCHPPFEQAIGGSCTVTLAFINGLQSVAWIGGGQVRYSTWDSALENFALHSIVNLGDGAVVPGKIALAEVNGQPAIAYIKAVDNLGQLKYRRYNGTEWIETSTSGQIQDFNPHVAMTTINNQPYIAYSVKTSSTTSQLRCTFNNGTRFIDDVVKDDLHLVNHVVGIAEFNNQPAVIISANPFRVYFFRDQPSQSVNEIRPIYFCECSSKIFTNRLTHLNEVARWESSAHGFADTPVTDSPQNSLRPIMKTRKTNAAIVIWEDYNKSNNCTNPPCIRAATFRNVNQDQLRGSGTKSWFDYDFGISGQDPDLTLDLFERVNSVYEKPKPDSEAGFHGRHISINELPGNELYSKVCDFSTTIADEESPSGPEGCDISTLENNVISFDQFVSERIVRKIRIKSEFVQYHTYNASGILTPIVSTCNVTLEIHGTPEIVALRLRNENQVTWGMWCPWSPQISDFIMEKTHKISGGSGIKEICIQAMTYVGITTEFCLPIIADYETVVFETRFYKNTDAEGNEITTFDEVDNNGFFPLDLDEKLIALPLSDGISVASLDIKGGWTECADSSGCGENEVCVGGRCIAKTATILVEIIPNQELDESNINFDVVQQGTNDQRGQVSQKGKNNDGKVLYRGDFVIEREDKVFNTDGLARVNPSFPSTCEDVGSETASVSDTYIRDIFNEIGEDITVEGTETTDPLIDFRQTTSGRVGVSVDLRSLEDPYFIFGDPNYSLQKTDGQRLGVPFQVAKTDIKEGIIIEQPPGCSESDEPGGSCAPGSVWIQSMCECLKTGG